MRTNLSPSDARFVLATWVGLPILAIVLFLVMTTFAPARAAEPETSPTQSAIVSLEAAKTELTLPLDELNTESIRLQTELSGTIQSCQEARVEWLEASASMIMAGGALNALENISTDPMIAELISRQIEEARLLLVVHEAEMAVAIARAGEIEATQTTLVTQRDEIATKIREIKDAVATLDEAISDLKATGASIEDTRSRRVARPGETWDEYYARIRPEESPSRTARPVSYDEANLMRGERGEIPEAFAACMTLPPDRTGAPSTLEWVLDLSKRDH